MQIDSHRFNLADLVHDIAEEIIMTVTSHEVVFSPCGETWLYADEEKIGQVFNNLISNAVKYSPVGSPIKVACSKNDTAVTISIEDKGMGIDAAELPMIFDRYYRVNVAEVKHIAGFGIGLYLCAEIIKRHQGKIWAESKVGEGSTFYFRLPLAADL